MNRWDNKRSPITDHCGFTLIEVMAAAAVMAIAVAGIIQFGNLGSASGKSNALDLDFAILTSNLEAALSSDCTNLLAGQNFNPAAAQPLTTLQIPATATIIATTIVPPGPPPTGLVVKSISFSQVPVSLVAPPGFFKYQTNLNIQAIKVTGSGSALPGAPTYSKDFPIVVWSDGAKVLTCEQEIPTTGAKLVMSSVCVAGVPTVSAAWNSTNSVAVYAAEVVDAAGNPYPLSVSPATVVSLAPAPPPATYNFTLLLTDSSGVQSYGSTNGTAAVPVTQTLFVGACGADAGPVCATPTYCYSSAAGSCGCTVPGAAAPSPACTACATGYTCNATGLNVCGTTQTQSVQCKCNS